MYYNHALELARSGSLTEARDRLLAVLALAPDMINAHAVLGKVYAQLGGYESAIACWDAVLKLDPQHEGARAAKAKAERLLVRRDSVRFRRGLLRAGGGVMLVVIGGLLLPAYRVLSQRRPSPTRAPRLEPVRAALGKSPGLKGAELGVSFQRGGVQLRGTVDSNEQKELASAVAANKAPGYAVDLSSVIVTHRRQIACLMRLLRSVGAGRFDSVEMAFERGALHIRGAVHSEADSRLLQQWALDYLGIPDVAVSGMKIGRFCVVQPGDSLWAIAQRYYGNGNSWGRIADANPGLARDMRSLQVGTRLKIPALE
jgi:tetratricopeptide (TPR) repeat protein/phage tail protein X